MGYIDLCTQYTIRELLDVNVIWGFNHETPFYRKRGPLFYWGPPGFRDCIEYLYYG